MTPKTDNLPAAFSHLPYIDQYLGAWAMWEPKFNGLMGHAQQINVQLHLDQQQRAEAQAAVAARGSTEITVTSGKIAVIELHGSLLKHASSFSGGTSMVAARRQIRAATRDADVAGILLHLDTPGGTVAGTADLAADIAAARAEKPTWAYCEDLCASAGYWLASQTGKIFSNESALVGSIGVFSVVHDLSKAAEEQGVKVEVVRFGQFKGSGVPGTEVTDEQLAEMQKIVDAFGDDFVNAVAEGRGVSRATAETLADGRIHKSDVALQLKLIDGVQSFDATLEQLIEETQKTNSTNNRRSRAMTKDEKVGSGQKAEGSEDVLLSSVETRKPAAASIEELEAACPGASSDFVLAQAKKGATRSQAVEAYSAKLAEENSQLRAAAADRDKADADGKTNAKTNEGPKGSKALGDTGGATDSDASTDYMQLAQDVMDDKGCTWREACMVVKRKHEGAHAAFMEMAPPARESS